MKESMQDNSGPGRWEAKKLGGGDASVVSLTHLYNDLGVVIPAPYQVRDKLQRESRLKRLDSGSSPE